MEKLRVLDLFSGIGGFSLGLERTGGFETVAFCEIDPFCQKVLKKHWPDVPIFEDVRELTADAIGPVDIITGGYPCQPFSQAGKRRGAEDDRHLWPEMYRLVVAFRPTWVFAENVAGHISLGLDEVLSDLEAEGYACRPLVIPACALDAPHRRDRLWLLAHAPRNEQGRQGAKNPSGRRTRTAPREEQKFRDDCGLIPNAVEQQRYRRGNWFSWWRWEPQEALQNVRGRRRQKAWLSIPKPLLGRVAYGVPDRVDRLKSLGNAVVPQIPEIIGRAILMAENQMSDARTLEKGEDHG